MPDQGIEAPVIVPGNQSIVAMDLSGSGEPRETVGSASLAEKAIVKVEELEPREVTM